MSSTSFIVPLSPSSLVHVALAFRFVSLFFRAVYACLHLFVYVLFAMRMDGWPPASSLVEHKGVFLKEKQTRAREVATLAAPRSHINVTCQRKGAVTIAHSLAHVPSFISQS